MTVAATEPLILVKREGALTHVTLNRPRAINALNIEMFQALREAFAEPGESTVFLLDGAGERGFCGGGDIKEIAQVADTRVLFRLEYSLDHEVHTSAVPVVAIMDGITMGGGIGLGGHAAYRVVTERSRLAMPEVRIGLMPDVGGHLLLARAPGRLGEYLAITAGELTPGDAIALGFADHYVPSERLETLREALAAGTDPESAIASVAEPAPESPLLQVREWFDEIADAALGDERGVVADPAGAALRLVTALEASTHEEARSIAKLIREMSPVSVAATLAQIARTRAESLDLAGVLEDDFRILPRFATLPNFAEGVRAQVIDKDRNPKWDPRTIEQLENADLAQILAPLDAGEDGLGLSRDA
ncbi:enoyl-CoA hydratase/isomerase family protein [Leucobacter denitrificans]|uniref:3-hydroxyisobutyryl-CoA hydrolase n=1 Tax=Leucobacter denitrificans TaxID=683042 RepID=A0A7G9S6G0_9MICO|nr:enoyl-CoA hydratase/isomerase family protein [Leucobacter denitrificans]QNN63435.1 enoyl-CoA hydratase/isomerase family protein [Leucobacter denitrificans]